MILLSVAGACAYGVADFFGGMASRKAHVLRVVVISAPASLAIELVLLPVLGASWNAGSIGWGALSGVASAFAFSLLYLALSIGPMSVMAPITAIVSALLPAIVGLIGGERLSVAGVIGIPVALCAIALVTVNRRTATEKIPMRAIVVAVLAGAAIAAQLITLDAAPHDSGVAPLIIGRTVSSLLVLSVVLFVRTSHKGKVPIIVAAAAGCLDSLANLFFLLAAREGMLSVSAVIVALYPAATVLLAAVVLKERIRRNQWLGLAAAATGVILLASS